MILKNCTTGSALNYKKLAATRAINAHLRYCLLCICLVCFFLIEKDITPESRHCTTRNSCKRQNGKRALTFVACRFRDNAMTHGISDSRTKVAELWIHSEKLVQSLLVMILLLLQRRIQSVKMMQTLRRTISC
jgi:hypothetical protein